MSEIVVTEHDQGSVVEAPRGDRTVFRLKENPGTGYAWEAESVEWSVVGLIVSASIKTPGMAICSGGTTDPALRGEVAREPGDPPGAALSLGYSGQSPGAPGGDDTGGGDQQWLNMNLSASIRRRRHEAAFGGFSVLPFAWTIGRDRST